MNCVDCGSTKVKTVVEHEVLRWGEKDTFECYTPVQHCQACGGKWLDKDGMKAQDLACFKFEKSKGIVRTKFCSEAEKQLWESA